MSRLRWEGRAVAIALALVLWLVTLVPARADGVVRVFYFYSPECTHCQAVDRDVLPGLRERYGSRLELRMFDGREPHNYEVLLKLEEQYGVENGGFPEVFIGSDVLIGRASCRERVYLCV